MTTRRLRAFNRWMSSNAIHHSAALHLTDDAAGISVFAKRDLTEGDSIATIPKQACLTVKTTGAAEVIEGAGLDGCLGLSVAVMFERSLGSDSPWAGYLQLLPKAEELPLVWSLEEVDGLLRGTELHKTVKQDKGLIYEDWRECILPLIDSEEFALDPNFFGLENYFAARSLVASRSFQIDDYHGSGMVPLADLFNHKTGAEDVHFTSTPSSDKLDDSDEHVTDDEDSSSDELQMQTSQCKENGSVSTLTDQSSPDGPESESGDRPENPLVLEMILVKDVKAGAEVFNTYGSVGNAALLHRYGFTEEDNPYDIVNIDLELVVKWSSSLFTDRHTRARVNLWRELGYYGCVSQNSEYFEISYEGEPQLELLILLYIFLLSEEEYTKLDFTLATKGDIAECTISNLFQKGGDMLLTKSVCEGLLSLADMRESLYGPSSLQHDVETLRKCNSIQHRKLYHSLVLRVSERKIIRKLRSYAEKGAKCLGKAQGPHARKKLKS